MQQIFEIAKYAIKKSKCGLPGCQVIFDVFPHTHPIDLILAELEKNHSKRDKRKSYLKGDHQNAIEEREVQESSL